MAAAGTPFARSQARPAAASVGRSGVGAPPSTMMGAAGLSACRAFARASRARKAWPGRPSRGNRAPRTRMRPPAGAGPVGAVQPARATSIRRSRNGMPRPAAATSRARIRVTAPSRPTMAASIGSAGTGASGAVMAGAYNVTVIGHEPQFFALVAAVAARYAGSGRLVAGYVAGKLRRDSVTRAVLAEAASGGLGEVVDLGCGRGQLGVALLLAGAARSVRGLELAPRALAQAAQAAAGLAFRAEARDLARDASVAAADTVLVVDVLYRLPDAAQAELLAAAARAARRLVVIRMLDPDRG